VIFSSGAKPALTGGGVGSSRMSRLTRGAGRWSWHTLRGRLRRTARGTGGGPDFNSASGWRAECGNRASAGWRAPWRCTDRSWATMRCGHRCRDGSSSPAFAIGSGCPPCSGSKILIGRSSSASAKRTTTSAEISSPTPCEDNYTPPSRARLERLAIRARPRRVGVHASTSSYGSAYGSCCGLRNSRGGPL
jgi:hypothetical protein